METNKEIVIATSNEHKLIEFKRMLEPLGYKVDSLKEFNLDIDVEETGKTFEENAIIKAQCIANKLPNKIVIADDSGLEIKALDGFPGIYSARFMEGQPYLAKRQAIIEKMKDIEDREANFTSAIAIVNYQDKPLTFVGKTYGTIAFENGGENGFGYDPIFFSTDLQKTFGQASDQEKDSVSHRGRALQKLVDFLLNN